MTPAEIIYQRRIAVLEYASPSGQCGRGLPGLRHLSDPLLRVEGRGRPLRPRRARCPRPATNAPDARGHPHPRGRRALDPGRARADHRLSPIRRPAREPGLLDRQVDRAKASWSPTVWAGDPSASARAAAITAATTGSGDRGGEEGRALRVLPGHRGPGELVCIDSFYIGKLKGVGKVYQLTAIDVFTRWAVVAIVLGPVHRHPHHALHRPGAAFLSRHGVRVRAMLERQWARIRGPRLSGLPGGQGARGTSASPPVPPTTTPCANASTRPSSKSAGARPSTAVTSPRSASSRPKPTPGCSPTTTVGATTATTCGAAHPIRSSTTTRETRQHDDHQPQSPSVTSTLGPEGLAQGNLSACRSHDHTFVRPFRNFHRPTHATGSRQCVPWPTGFA